MIFTPRPLYFFFNITSQMTAAVTILCNGCRLCIDKAAFLWHTIKGTQVLRDLSSGLVQECLQFFMYCPVGCGPEPAWPFCRRKKYVASTGTWTLDLPARSLVAVLTALSRLTVNDDDDVDDYDYDDDDNNNNNNWNTKCPHFCQFKHKTIHNLLVGVFFEASHSVQSCSQITSFYSNSLHILCFLFTNICTNF